MVKWSHAVVWVGAGSLIALACGHEDTDDQASAGAGSGGRASGGSAGRAAGGSSAGKAGRGGNAGSGAVPRGGASGAGGAEGGSAGDSGSGSGGVGQGGAGAPGGIGGGGAGGIAECQQHPEDFEGDSCSEDDRCNWGEECCCGACHPSVECNCFEGKWSCTHTDACLEHDGVGGEGACSEGGASAGGASGAGEGGRGGAR